MPFGATSSASPSMLAIFDLLALTLSTSKAAVRPRCHFEAVTEVFLFDGANVFLDQVTAVNDFRNTYVAHAEKELRDAATAEDNLRTWMTTLASIVAK